MWKSVRWSTRRKAVEWYLKGLFVCLELYLLGSSFSSLLVPICCCLFVIICLVVYERNGGLRSGQISPQLTQSKRTWRPYCRQSARIPSLDSSLGRTLSPIPDRQTIRQLVAYGRADRFTRRADMRNFRISKVLRAESEYPNIVEVAVARTGLATELSRQITAFHKSRQIKLRHGRTTLREGQIYYRWCFSDLVTARAFLERLGGAVVDYAASGLR
jgi:hypothetical protein